MSHSSDGDRPHDALPRQNRRARQTSSGLVVSADDVESGDSQLAGCIVSMLLEAGFLALLIESGHVVLSGFVITDEADGQVQIHWTGTDKVDALPYRRTFLGAYASALRQAGLAVTYVERDGEPYLRCERGMPPAPDSRP